MSTSFPPTVQRPPQHQVFLNFRGAELRNNFVSHLEKALRRDGINVYIDGNETRGKDLSILFSRIEESRIALAIFSSRYAESNWCLDELEKIMKCVDFGKLVVIPIFFKVETDDVKNIKGEFGDKFWELAKTCNGEKVEKWKQALKNVPRKMGYTVDVTSDEGQIISQIVVQVIEVLSTVSTNVKREIAIENPCAEVEEELPADPDSPPPLFGIKTSLKQLKEKLDLKYENTLTIGVVGMPGIGKTTLTKNLYEEWQQEFQRYVFLDNVRQKWKQGTINRDILIKELLKDDGVDTEFADLPLEIVKELLLKKKSLVVLDNVSDKEHIGALLGDRDQWIKRGSRILIMEVVRI